MSIAEIFSDIQELLTCAHWAAVKDGLLDQSDNARLPHEVRMFALNVSDKNFLNTARDIPKIIFEIGAFAIVRKNHE